MMRSLRFNFRSFTASSLISSVACPRLVPVIAAAIVTTTVLAPTAAFGQEGLEPLEEEDSIFLPSVAVPFNAGFGQGAATDSNGSFGATRGPISAGVTALEEQDRPAQAITDRVIMDFTYAPAVCIGKNPYTEMLVVQNCGPDQQQIKMLLIPNVVNCSNNGNSSAGGFLNIALGRKSKVSNQGGKVARAVNVGASFNLGNSYNQVEQIQIPGGLLNVLLDLKLIDFTSVTIPPKKAYLPEHLLTIELTKEEQERCKELYGAQFCRTLQDAIAQQQYRIAEYVQLISELLNDPDKLAELGLKIPSSTNPEADRIEKQMILAAKLLQFEENIKFIETVLGGYQERLDEARQTPNSPEYMEWLEDIVKLAEQERLLKLAQAR